MISVIVPFKNSKEWIGRCVSSLMAVEGDVEFILVDDHSRDSGENIARKMVEGDSRFTIVENTRKAGVSGARNTGLDIAKGEWITFVDADDEMLPDAIHLYGKMIAKDPSALIHQANHLRYYAKLDKTKLKYANEAGQYDLNNMPVAWCMVWNKLYSHSLLSMAGIYFDESLRYGEDELFNLECLASVGRIHHASKKAVTVTKHFDNDQRLSKIKDDKDLLKQAKQLMEFLKRQEDPEMRIFVCRLLAEHWGSATFIDIFGRDQEEKK